MSLWRYGDRVVLRRDVSYPNAEAGWRHETFRSETADYRHLKAPPLVACYADAWHRSRSGWGLYVEHDPGYRLLDRRHGQREGIPQGTDLAEALSHAVRELHDDGVTHGGIDRRFLLFEDAPSRRVAFLKNDRARYEDWRDATALRDLSQLKKACCTPPHGKPLVPPDEWGHVFSHYLTSGNPALRAQRKQAHFLGKERPRYDGYEWSRVPFEHYSRRQREWGLGVRHEPPFHERD